MSLKSNFYVKIGVVIFVMSQILCTEQTEKTPPARPTQVSEQKDTTLTENFATAQIALNVETKSGNTLAYVTLNMSAFLTNKGKYKVKTLLVDDGDNGPFNNFSIIDKAVISKNGELKILLTFELQAQRINWETAEGKLTGFYGQSTFKETVKSEGGSLKGSATLIFDEKSMNLMAQKTVVEEKVKSGLNNADTNFEQWYSFATKNLNICLATTIFWINPACPTGKCTTGQMRENK